MVSSFPPHHNHPPIEFSLKMPDDSSNSKGYTYTGSGTNSQVCCFPLQGFKVIDFVHDPQGNHYCSREGTNGGSGYHYSNTYVKSSDSGEPELTVTIVPPSNGSYYYQNTNGSTYYNTGSGQSTYTSPSGYTKTSGK